MKACGTQSGALLKTETKYSKAPDHVLLKCQGAESSMKTAFFF